ncbi:carbohydrate ABC transporter permease [Marinilactibacillus psychrotolerans]|uniref:Sugar ABC transporter permease protein n=1 Tax=Marinilactibacillus psychrotolerans TaxID=191770 RepID=A0AAV3WQQ8_9LACT|nr:sugar ABC transporter permease [Marinilactibacillus psychrotolerans]GEL67934.1 ABC transporter permease [Marinilactibacillus psychrotolerans]GEQ35375.1 sugar ABC transporter permease protein [Marinilactibacillus psychrotolerans]SDD26652.1 raffinose/stachyose/melibiose transport system permease protein [Marinilactibacillus psychrotolerans]
MKNKEFTFWLFITPVLLSLTLVVILPVVMGLFYSFTNWNGLNFTSFVGFNHYKRLLGDGQFLRSLWFTVKFSIASIILLNVIGLSLALLVTSKLKSRNILRTVFFMPNLIGGLILGFIWQFIFIRVFASIGELIGVESLQVWLATPGTGFWGLVILTVWQMAGYIMIIYIAYLQGVPKELLESAEIDGATPFQKFRHVIFPLIAPAFTVTMFLTLSNSFKIYDQNLSLTGGGPYNSTQMVAMNIVDTAFSGNQMAYGQSKAIIFFLIVAVISLSQVYYNKKREVDL